MPATKEKPVETDFDKSKKLIEDRRVLERTAESILMEESGRFDADEKAVFAELGWDARRIERERGRTLAVRDRLREFGSWDELAAAETHAIVAEKSAKAEGNELRDKIAELQTQLARVEDNAKACRKQADVRRVAMGHLRGALLPEAIRRRHGEMSRDVNTTFQFVKQARRRVQAIDELLTIDPRSQSGVLHFRRLSLLKVRCGGRDLMKPTPQDRVADTVDLGKWQEWCDELRAERAELVATIEDAEQDYGEAQREVDALLSFYTLLPPPGVDARLPSPADNRLLHPRNQGTPFTGGTLLVGAGSASVGVGGLPADLKSDLPLSTSAEARG